MASVWCLSVAVCMWTHYIDFHWNDFHKIFNMSLVLDDLINFRLKSDQGLRQLSWFEIWFFFNFETVFRRMLFVFNRILLIIYELSNIGQHRVSRSGFTPWSKYFMEFFFQLKLFFNFSHSCQTGGYVL
jgi:hypothetical protein